MSIAHRCWESGSSHIMGCRTAVAVCGFSKDATAEERADFISCSLCSFSLISSADHLKPEKKDENCFVDQSIPFSETSSLTWASLPLGISEAEEFPQQTDTCPLGHCLTSQFEDTLCKPFQNDQLITGIYPDQVGFDAIHMHNACSMPLEILEDTGQKESFEGEGRSNARSRSSSPSSSIGVCEDSSCTSNEALVGTEEEAQSSLRTGPLEDLISLEKSLPLRKGLSRFINGKSRSFSCLSDVHSVKELAKAENPYSRRRRFNFHRTEDLGCNRYLPLRKSIVGISKKSTCSSKINLAVALTNSTETKGANIAEWECRSSFHLCDNKSISSRSL
ncbi:hypothetical protein O6H91_08G023900 [Diphasiastrum complanatum]|uniref:Uncharacterized protein n=1 Tax=Diphasiastrum complanatum TaxID=34168 RepID=A0ACC2CVS0_DIPCM|nr:hypothetical protein O6H91_08G023900 [Diphasiastrum complanatum]